MISMPNSICVKGPYARAEQVSFHIPGVLNLSTCLLSTMSFRLMMKVYLNIIDILTRKVGKTKAIWNYVFANELCSIMCKKGRRKELVCGFCSSVYSFKIKTTEKQNFNNLIKNS